MATPIQQIADHLEPAIRDEFLAIVVRMSQEVPLEILVEAMERGDRLFVMDLYRRASENTVYQTTIGSLFEAALTQAAALTGSAIGYGFTIRQPRVASWITRNVGQLITGITAQTMQGINNIVMDGYVNGLPPLQQARIIRDAIGVLPRHTAAAGRMARALERQGLSPEVIERRVRDYELRQLNYRSRMISHTESMRAANAGQYEMWGQMIEDGFLKYDETWFVWDVTEDDRLCPYCAPMDDKRVRYGEWFEANTKGFPRAMRDRSKARAARSAEKGKDPNAVLVGDQMLKPLRRVLGTPFPPLHPKCRCVLKLEFD